jgi:hypothetical protein
LDKTVFVKFKISKNFDRYIDKTNVKQPKIHRKNPYQPMEFENLKEKIREPKISRLLPNLCDFHKKCIGWGMD